MQIASMAASIAAVRDRMTDDGAGIGSFNVFTRILTGESASKGGPPVRIS
jgi:hypothetical protein